MEYRYFERKGFTFSEVLITLGIIGVVAVLTLTTVIPEIQNKQNIAKWKKEYSVINNAFNEVLADGVTMCNYTQWGSCDGQAYTDEFLQAIKSKLKVVDYCGTASFLSSDHRCDYYNYSTGWMQERAKYKWSGVANIYSRYKALGVKNESNPGSYSPYGINAYNFSKLALLLNDGAVLYLGESHGGPWMVVDVNNFKKGPNEFGRDVFVINVTSNIKKGEHYIKAMGAQGTYSSDDINGDEVCECSPSQGVKTGNYFIGVGSRYLISGVCCSAKYLLE